MTDQNSGLFRTYLIVLSEWWSVIWSASDAANLKMIHALVGLEQRWFQQNQITNPHSKVLLAVSV